MENICSQYFIGNLRNNLNAHHLFILIFVKFERFAQSENVNETPMLKGMRSKNHLLNFLPERSNGNKNTLFFKHTTETGWGSIFLTKFNFRPKIVYLLLRLRLFSDFMKISNALVDIRHWSENSSYLCNFAPQVKIFGQTVLKMTL